jgi:hypothetical protein
MHNNDNNGKDNAGKENLNRKFDDGANPHYKESKKPCVHVKAFRDCYTEKCDSSNKIVFSPRPGIKASSA